MTTEQTENTTGPTMGPGPLLRKARKDHGLELQDIADRLHLKASLIAELEENKFDQNINATFIRGYLRSYARLVNVPCDQVVQAYDAVRGEFATPVSMQSFSGRTRKESNDNKLMLLTYGIFGLLIVGTVIWWLQSPASIVNFETVTASDEQKVSEVVADTGIMTSEKVESEMAGTEDASPATVPGQTATLNPVEEQENAVVDTVENELPAEASVTESATEPEPETPVVAAQSSTALSLDFTGECWLEVRDNQGKVMISGTYQAGKQLEIDGEAPYELIVGAPQNVTIIYQDETLALPSNQIARISVPKS